MGKFPGVSRQALDVIMRVFLSGRQRTKPCEDGAKRALKILSPGLEDGARDHKPKNAGDLKHLKKLKTHIFA